MENEIVDEENLLKFYQSDDIDTVIKYLNLQNLQIQQICLKLIQDTLLIEEMDEELIKNV